MATADALIRLHETDNVAVVLRPVKAGQVLRVGSVELVAPCDLGMGHKLALRAIADGEDIHKYGMPIGVAVGAIALGDHVHLHNIKSRYTVIEDIEGDVG